MFLIWLKFHCILLSPQGIVGNKSSLVKVLAWCERQPQSLSELIITFTEESNNPNFSSHFFATLYANKVDVWYIRRINEHLKSSVDGNEVRGIVIEKKYMVKDIQMKRIVLWSQECKDISHHRQPDYLSISLLSLTKRKPPPPPPPPPPPIKSNNAEGVSMWWCHRGNPRFAQHRW